MVVKTTIKLRRMKSVKKNKAQFKIQQMAFMLLAVTLFFVLAGVFVLTFKLSSIKESATEISKENAQLLVTKLANSPEFSCGEAFDYSKVACIDWDKVMALKQSEDKYKDFWDVSNIEIRKIYPDMGDVECTSSNYPDCGVIRVKEGGVLGAYISNFVILCRKDSIEGSVYDKCEISRLMVSYNPVS